MSISIQERLESKIDYLKGILENINTESLVGSIATEFGVTINTSENVFSKTKLSSPFKQYLYLVGLLLSTDSKKVSNDTSKPPMNEIKKVLNEIVELYGEMFYPEEGESIDEKWIEVRKISMPVFLNYFNTNSITYEEQIIERIMDWFTPYSEYIEEAIGLTVEELINMFTFIRNNLQERFDNLQYLAEKVKEDQETFFEYMKVNKVSFEQARQELNLPNTIKFGQELQLIHHIEIKELRKVFGDIKTQTFIDLFTMTRKKRDFYYYTETNPFEYSPIWKKSDDLLFVPMHKQVIHAIQLQLTALMENSNLKTSFYKNRDNKTEEKTEELFRSFFKEKANYYTSVFENDKSQNEHDLVIEHDNNLFIVEIKASKVKEPFRNPEKAYQRIKRDFRSDGGIQKAYDQGLNLKNLILGNDETILYDSKGNEVVKFDKSKIKKINILVITAENMGILASNLSYLLEKPQEEPYPWSCNLYDLETALDGILYKKKDVNFFLDYLSEREATHNYIISSDELEILGFYLINGVGSILSLVRDKDTIVQFTPDLSDVFDEIYFEKKGLGIKPSKQSSEKINKYGKKKKRKKNRKRNRRK